MVRTPWQIQKAVVFALFIRELKSRFGSYKGGYIWMLVEPLAHIIMLSLIFTYIRDRSLVGIDFPVFLVTGIVPFLLFKNVALRVMDGVDANRGLFAYRQIRPSDTFIARTLLDSALSVIIFGVLLAGMAWVGMDVPFRDPLSVAFIFGLMILLGLGLGMFLCIVVHYMPESKTFIRLLFLPMYLMSGIIFPVTRLPKEFLPYLMWNPLLHAIETLRGAFFSQYHTVPGLSPLFVVMTTLVVLFLGLSWYRVKRYELLAI